MIANFLFFTAATGLILTLLDVFLGESGTKSLLNALTRAWDYLDSLKRKGIWNRPSIKRLVETCTAISVFLVVLYIVLENTVFDLGMAVSAGGYWLGWISEDHFGRAVKIYWYVTASFVGLALVPLLPLLAIALAQFGLWTCELIIRRLAEYPKGPLIALSVVLAALGVLLKAIP